MRKIKHVCCGTVFSTVMMSFTAVSLTVQAADPVTFAWNSEDGDLANPLNWTNGVLPPAGVTAQVYGRKGMVTLSKDLALSGQFVVNGKSDFTADFGEYGLDVSNRITIGNYKSSFNNVNLISGRIKGIGDYLWVGADGGCTNTFTASGEGTEVYVKGSLSVGYTSNSCGNVFAVTNGANLTVSNTYACLEAGTKGSGNLIELDGAGSVYVNYFGYVGRITNSCNNRMVLRDIDTAEFKEGFVVGNNVFCERNSLLVTNVANLVTKEIIIGNSGAFNTGEVYLVSSESPVLPNFKIGEGAFSTNNYLMVDGGGNSYELGMPFWTFSLKRPGNMVELRNMNVSYTGSRYFDAQGATNSQYVIGKDATVTSTFTNYTPFNFRKCAPGYGITVDEGQLLLPNKNGNIYLGESASLGREFAFTVKNGGKVDLSGFFNIRTDGCTLDVLSGGMLDASKFICEGNDAVITISNAVLHADSILMPDNTVRGWATNNVIRFIGTAPRMTADSFTNNTTNNVDINSSDNRTGVIFEYVLPENGYETVPLETTGSIWLCGKYCGLRVNASAYKGERKWMTLMRAKSIPIRMGNEAFCAALPQDPELRIDYRFVTVGGVRELQIMVRRPHNKGLVMVLK